MLEIDGKMKTFEEIRQNLYEKIIDESVFIARASEGAITLDWIMEQPISIRKKYLKMFQEEVLKRNKEMEQNNSTKTSSNFTQIVNRLPVT